MFPEMPILTESGGTEKRTSNRPLLSVVTLPARTNRDGQVREGLSAVEGDVDFDRYFGGADGYRSVPDEEGIRTFDSNRQAEKAGSRPSSGVDRAGLKRYDRVPTDVGRDCVIGGVLTDGRSRRADVFRGGPRLERSVADLRGEIEPTDVRQGVVVVANFDSDGNPLAGGRNHFRW